MKGPNFIALQKLFDEIAEEVADYVDLITERITQLGGIAEGTAPVIAQRSTLAEYPLPLADGKDHVEALSTALAAFGKLVRRAIDETDESGDRDTADLFTEVSRGINKQLWFLEAHLQSSR